MVGAKLPTTTQLRDLYDALGALSEEEQVQLAEHHADDASRLIDRFLHSVRAAAQLPAEAKGFHSGGRKKLPDPPVPPDEIGSTFDFASQVAAGVSEVRGHPELTFRYVDREIFPGRTGSKKTEMAKRTLDLLLVGADGLPIVGELKRGGDSLTYYALVQALMHASELVSEGQRQRLDRTYPDHGFVWRPDGPFVDVYLIVFDVPYGANRTPSTELSHQVIAQLLADDRVTAVLRRIELLEAEADGNRLRYLRPSSGGSPARPER